MKITLFDNSNEFYSALEKADYDSAYSYQDIDFNQKQKTNQSVYCSVEGCVFADLKLYMKNHPKSFSSFISYQNEKKNIIFIEIF